MYIIIYCEGHVGKIPVWLYQSDFIWMSRNNDCILKVNTVLIPHARIMLSHRPRASKQASLNHTDLIKTIVLMQFKHVCCMLKKDWAEKVGILPACVFHILANTWGRWVWNGFYLCWRIFSVSSIYSVNKGKEMCFLTECSECMSHECIILILKWSSEVLNDGPSSHHGRIHNALRKTYQDYHILGCDTL